MKPYRRHQLLAHVGHKNLLPSGTTADETQRLDGLITSLGWPRWQLTAEGWRELERLAQTALAEASP